MSDRESPAKKTAVVLIGNEVLSGAAKRTLESAGYEVRTNIESCARADFALLGSYFVLLGIVNHLRSINPRLPLILLTTPDDAPNGAAKYFRGVIKLSGNSGMEAREKIAEWFKERQNEKA